MANVIPEYEKAASSISNEWVSWGPTLDGVEWLMFNASVSVAVQLEVVFFNEQPAVHILLLLLKMPIKYLQSKRSVKLRDNHLLWT